MMFCFFYRSIFTSLNCFIGMLSLRFVEGWRNMFCQSERIARSSFMPEVPVRSFNKIFTRYEYDIRYFFSGPSTSQKQHYYIIHECAVRGQSSRVITLSRYIWINFEANTRIVRDDDGCVMLNIVPRERLYMMQCLLY